MIYLNSVQILYLLTECSCTMYMNTRFKKDKEDGNNQEWWTSIKLRSKPLVLQYLQSLQLRKRNLVNRWFSSFIHRQKLCEMLRIVFAIKNIADWNCANNNYHDTEKIKVSFCLHKYICSYEKETNIAK